jgi:hypothetical protein
MLLDIWPFHPVHGIGHHPAQRDSVLVEVMDGVLVIETVPARRAVEVPQVIEDEVSVGGKAAEGGLELFPGLPVGQGLVEDVPRPRYPTRVIAAGTVFFSCQRTSGESGG